MISHLSVEHLSVDRLLANWRWLCPEEMSLVARNAFADLFLHNRSGNILRLDVSAGKLTKVSDSETEFQRMAQLPESEKNGLPNPTSALPLQEV